MQVYLMQIWPSLFIIKYLYYVHDGLRYCEFDNLNQGGQTVKDKWIQMWFIESVFHEPRRSRIMSQMLEWYIWRNACVKSIEQQNVLSFQRVDIYNGLEPKIADVYRLNINSVHLLK